MPSLEPVNATPAVDPLGILDSQQIPENTVRGWEGGLPLGPWPAIRGGWTSGVLAACKHRQHAYAEPGFRISTGTCGLPTRPRTTPTPT